MTELFFFYSKWDSVDVRSALFLMVPLYQHVSHIWSRSATLESFLEVGTDKGHWPLPSAARCDGDVIVPERQTKLIKKESGGGGGGGAAVWEKRWRVLQDTWGLLVKWAGVGKLKAPICETCGRSYFSVSIFSLENWDGWAKNHSESLKTFFSRVNLHGNGAGTSPPTCKGCCLKIDPAPLCPPLCLH